MWLLHLSLRRPVTIFVASLSLALLAYLAFVRMPVDIFPNMNLPVIVVAQPYGGMDPAQMEGYLVYYYEFHFLFMTGIDHVGNGRMIEVGQKLAFVEETVAPGGPIGAGAKDFNGHLLLNLAIATFGEIDCAHAARA